MSEHPPGSWRNPAVFEANTAIHVSKAAELAHPGDPAKGIEPNECQLFFPALTFKTTPAKIDAAFVDLKNRLAIQLVELLPAVIRAEQQTLWIGIVDFGVGINCRLDGVMAIIADVAERWRAAGTESQEGASRLLDLMEGRADAIQRPADLRPDLPCERDKMLIIAQRIAQDLTACLLKPGPCELCERPEWPVVWYKHKDGRPPGAKHRCPGCRREKIAAKKQKWREP